MRGQLNGTGTAPKEGEMRNIHQVLSLCFEGKMPDLELLQMAQEDYVVATRPTAPCNHNWIDATNEKVTGTDYCTKCGALRSQATRPTAPTQAPAKEGE